MVLNSISVQIGRKLCLGSVEAANLSDPRKLVGNFTEKTTFPRVSDKTLCADPDIDANTILTRFRTNSMEFMMTLIQRPK
jgi:hypothetical protein